MVPKARINALKLSSGSSFKIRKNDFDIVNEERKKQSNILFYKVMSIITKEDSKFLDKLDSLLALAGWSICREIILTVQNAVLSGTSSGITVTSTRHRLQILCGALSDATNAFLSNLVH